MILRNFISLWVFTVYMENSLQFEISLRSNWPKWNLHWSEFHFARSHVNADNEVTLHRSKILLRSEILKPVWILFRSHANVTIKGHEASITFHEKTWHQACRVFMLFALKKTTKKTYFLHYDIWVKTSYTTLYLLLHWNNST